MSARRHRAGRIVRSLLAAVVLLPLAATAVLAHPLGNFTINHHAGIRVEPDRVLLDVVIDQAEIPTFQAVMDLDEEHAARLDADPRVVVDREVAQRMGERRGRRERQQHDARDERPQDRGGGATTTGHRSPSSVCCARSRAAGSSAGPRARARSRAVRASSVRPRAAAITPA